jgi:hypothetical protein
VFREGAVVNGEDNSLCNVPVTLFKENQGEVNNKDQAQIKIQKKEERKEE